MGSHRALPAQIPLRWNLSVTRPDQVPDFNSRSGLRGRLVALVRGHLAVVWHSGR
jgi:hypothetical protein